MISYNFSGGRTSGFMVDQMLKRNGGELPDDHIVLFQNTGFEHLKTLEFVRDFEEKKGVKIVWLEYYCPDPSKRPSFKVVNYKTASRDGTPFRQLVKKRRRLPNVKERFCTAELKILTSKRYMVSLGHKKWRSAVGFRADEPDRPKNSKKDTRITPFYPLMEAGIVKQDIYEFWIKSNFDLQLENNNGTTPLGNCTMCFLKSEKTKAFICRTDPEIAAIWAGMEKEQGGTFRDKQSLVSLMDFVERQNDFDFSEETDVYCESDLGACTDW